MFNFLKKLKKEKPIQKISENSSINFKDLKLQDLTIKVKPNGNDIVIVIEDKKTAIEYIFDQEQSFILGYIFNEFALNKKIDNVFNLLKNGE